MYRKMKDDQKKVASEFFRYATLLAVIGIGDYSIRGSFWNMIGPVLQLRLPIFCGRVEGGKG